MKRWWAYGALAGVLCFSSAIQAGERVTVFAAASLTNALNDVAAAYQQKSGVKAIFSYASSSSLARQISQGAPADIYISANEKWMDYVEQQQAIEPDTRKTLLNNSLVLVAPNSYPQDEITLSASWNIADALQGTRLAVGDPNHVPAGIYTKESLKALALWQQAERVMARANNVRSALLLVERQEAMLGIVYKTDALISKNVKVVAEIPQQTHSPISYPVAIVKDKSNSKVQGFYDYLVSDEAAAIFAQYGFGEVE